MAQSYGLLKPLTNSGHKKLINNLVTKFGGRHHLRTGSKRNVPYYAAGWIGDEADMILIHVTSKKEKANFKTRVSRDKFGPKYEFESLSGNKTNLEMMERLARHAATLLFRKTEQQEYSGPRDTSFLDGYYMYRYKNSGPNYNGKDLPKAIGEQEMNVEFGETLKALGIYVKEHFPS
jgi:hypothetical protein